MKIDVMNVNDIELVVPLYIDYYNNCEDGCWTEATARRRIQQVLKIEDSYSLIIRDIYNITKWRKCHPRIYDNFFLYVLSAYALAICRPTGYLGGYADFSSSSLTLGNYRAIVNETK